MTKKQYSKPQMIKVDDAIKMTLGVGRRSRDLLFAGRRLFF